MAKIIRLLSLALVFILIGCAGQIPPSGGPVDTTPPQIVFSSPAQRGLNFDFRKITLRFDQYMSQRSVESAIYFPPFGSRDMSFDWSGKELVIDLKKSLEPDRTYILTIGATAIDLRNNYLGKAYNLVFSTGSQIDTGTVSGMIYSKKPQSYTVAAFPVTPDIDTLNPSMNLARYVTQSDDSGRYVLQGLANGKYRLICFDDQMRNFKYAPQTDLYASATHDVDVTKETQEVRDIDFIPATEDTSRPQLYSADLAKDGLIMLKFSEQIDTSTIKPSYFVVSDSATGRIVPVDFAARLEEDQYAVALGTKIPLLLRHKYSVTATDSVRDVQQNPMSPSDNTVVMRTDSVTTKFTPYYFNFSDSLQNVTSYDTLFCQFVSPAMGSDSNRVNLSLYDSSGNALPQFVKRESETIYRINTAGLSSLEWYTLKLNYMTDERDGSGEGSHEKDSVVVRHFRTIDFTALGDIEGKVLSIVAGEKVIVVAARPDGKRFLTFADVNGKFKLDGILAGTYDVSAYVQHDLDIAYFSGRSYPYQFAEPFGVYREPVKVRARWTTEGVAIKIF